MHTGSCLGRHRARSRRPRRHFDNFDNSVRLHSTNGFKSPLVRELLSQSQAASSDRPIFGGKPRRRFGLHSVQRPHSLERDVRRATCMRPRQSGHAVTRARKIFMSSHAQGCLFGPGGSSPKRSVYSAAPSSAAECSANFRASFFGTTSDHKLSSAEHWASRTDCCSNQ